MRLPPLRVLHAYLGMLIAPTVLFYAGTGILQVYSLHEAHGAYQPPAPIEAMGRLHKDQVLAERHHDAPSPGPAQQRAAPKPPPKPPHATPVSVLALKAWVAAVAAALFVSTLVGLWIGLRPGPRRRTHVALVVVGTLVPLALALLTG